MRLAARITTGCLPIESSEIVGLRLLDPSCARGLSTVASGFSAESISISTRNKPLKANDMQSIKASKNNVAKEPAPIDFSPECKLAINRLITQMGKDAFALGKKPSFDNTAGLLDVTGGETPITITADHLIEIGSIRKEVQQCNNSVARLENNLKSGLENLSRQIATMKQENFDFRGRVSKKTIYLSFAAASIALLIYNEHGADLILKLLSLLK